MTLGSLFDGIGAFPLAATRVGIVPVWAAEINPFGVKVTKHHFPHMRHVGDVTKLKGAALEPVDIITGGSPCQDFSVAGHRQGLLGERSGLFSHFIRIVDEMREATNGQYPKHVIWENVPGVFSSNEGEDFQNVVAAFIGAAEPVPLPRDSRRNSGVVRRGERTLIWRVLDARYFGVAQRRRRVFAVLSFGAQPRPEILFEPTGSKRHPSSSQTKRRENPDDARGSAPIGAWQLASGKDQVGTLQHNAGTKQWLGNQEAFSGDFHLVAFGANDSLNGGGSFRSDGVSPSLRAMEGSGVCSVAVAFNPSSNALASEVELAPTLVAKGTTGGFDGLAVAFNVNGHMEDSGVETAPTLLGADNGVKPCVAFTQNQRGEVCELGERAACLTGQSSVTQQPTLLAQKTIVRRLTPLECERLMGFPDQWTDLGADTHRYAALGNSIVVPVLEWILGRIVKEY